MTANRLEQIVDAQLGAVAAGPLAVALSGGMDSSVLLHCLSLLPAARARGLRAVHVDHGLHADSADWAAHCERLCARHDVAFVRVQAKVERDRGFGLEGAARRARFAALQGALEADEIVVFAHHREDQAETVLLKLLRGAGPEGLAAMRGVRPFGCGLAWRPLLDVPRSRLLEHARQFKLDWITDPSNSDTRIDRNFLRIEILPRLREHWPETDTSFSQSARWILAAADFVDTQSEQALARVQGLDPSTLHLREWLDLPEALRDPVLRRWLRENNLPEPTRYQAGELFRQLASAAVDKLPCLRWPGAEVRRYRTLMYALKPLQLPDPGWEHAWDGRPLELPAAVGTLAMIPNPGHHASPVTPSLRVRFRRGGETLRLNAGGYRRDLRDLFQEAGIPPWQRSRVPMVFDANDELLAIADLWTTDRGRAHFAMLGHRPAWNTH